MGPYGPMVFVAQFIDPRSNRNELTRIFMPYNDEADPTGLKANITKINLDQPLNQIKIESPVDPQVGLPSFYPIVFDHWEIRKELPYDALYEYAGMVTDKINQATVGTTNVNQDDYHDLTTEIMDPYEATRYYKFKLDGVPDTNQGIDYDTSYNNVYTSWGDSGVLHIAANGTIEGDMA